MRPSWAIAGVAAVLLSACGGDGQAGRLDLKTPGVETGKAVPAPSASVAPTATATPEATATPQPAGKPVTRAEKRVIKGWSDRLRQGRVTAASRYFQVPALVSNNTPGFVVLGTRGDVEEFNRTLPCGAKLIRTRRGADGFVVGVFRLTERRNSPAPCGTGVGEEAAVAFEIAKNRISKWVRVVEDDGGQDPMATPTPAPTTDAAPTIS